MSTPPTVLVLGDSHANVFKGPGWANLAPGIRWTVVQSHGATLSGLSNPRSKTDSARLFDAALQHPADAIVTLLGEVDCGYLIFYYADRDRINVRAAACKALENYRVLLSRCAAKAPTLVVSAPLPTIPDGVAIGEVAKTRSSVSASQRERTELTLWFNQELKKLCESLDIRFIDLDKASRGREGLVAPRLVRRDPSDHHYRQPAYRRMLARHLLPALAGTLGGADSGPVRAAVPRTLKDVIQANPHWRTEFAMLLPVLEQPGLRPNGVSLSDDKFRALLRTASGVSETIAAAHLVNKFCERSRRNILDEAAALLERADPGGLSVNPARQGEVTILSIMVDRQHRKALFAMAAALLATARCKRLYLVLTDEWNWRAWTRHGNRKSAEDIKAAFREQVAHFAAAERILRDVDARLVISVNPKPEDLSGLLGEVVIRYEGHLRLRTTRLYGKAIHALRPVVTATFSSTVQRGSCSDITLVRTREVQPGQRYFIPAAQLAQPISSSTPQQHESRVVLTMYGQDRIKKGLQEISPGEWDQIARFLDRRPAARWVLAGAEDVEEAVRAVPESIRRRYGERIEVRGFASLESLLCDSMALMALPRAFGGGVTATTASAAGVPVLVNSDPLSDIANALPPELHMKDFSASWDRLDEWFDDRLAWAHFAAAQQKCLQQRMDLVAKGDELFDILDDAREARGAASGAATRGSAGSPPVVAPASSAGRAA